MDRIHFNPFRPPGLDGALKAAGKQALSAPRQEKPEGFRSLEPPSIGLDSGFQPVDPKPDARALQAPPKDAQRAELERAGREFEAILMRHLAQAMRAGLGSESSGAPGGSHYYEGLIDEQLGRVLADSDRGLRLAETLGRQIANNREAPDGTD